MKFKILAALVFWSAVFGGIGAYRHRLYLRQLDGYGPHGPPPEPPFDPDGTDPVRPGVTNGQLLLLGWTARHRNESFFPLHAPKKAPGAIRIGVFGDSHVEGTEVANDFDMPTLLQKRFRAAGGRRVEILNFGVGGYGFSQAFLMWELFAKRYELDRAVFLVGHHYFTRDDTFAMGDAAYGFQHARYILRGGKPVLLPPAGSSPGEISSRYHGLRPVWRYLRYDARMPVQARMLLSAPTPSRFNPFYYAFLNSRREQLSIWRLLLERADAKTPVTVVVDWRADPDFAEAIGSDQLDYLLSGSDGRIDTLMLAPLSHWNAMGNRLRAEELFAYLTGKASVELPYIDLVPLPPAPARKPRPLHEFSHGQLSLDGRPVGRLMVHKRGAPQPHFYEPLNVRERRVAALFYAEGRDPFFVPLTAPPEASAELILAFRLDGEVQEAALGRASAPSGIMAALDEGPREWRGTSPRTGAGWEVKLTSRGFIDGLSIRASGKAGDASLRLGGREILRGSTDDAGMIVFKPLEGELVRIRSEEGQGFDPFRAKKSGIITVGANVPFIGYRIVPKLNPPFERPPRDPLR